MVHAYSSHPQRFAAVLGLVLLFTPLGEVVGQTPDRSNQGQTDAAPSPVVTVASSAEVEVTREALQAELDSLWGATGDEGDPARADRMTRRIQHIQRRLEHGDFRPGDVVLIRVVGQDRLSGKVIVGSDRSVELPGLEDRVDLSGLLYSEAGERIQSALDEYVRDARVQVRPLTRVAVLGGVGRPGFYDVSPATPVSEVLMAAGGPSGNAKLGELEIRRGGEDLLAEREVQLASATLEELGVQRGDELYVPVDRGGGDAWRWIGLATGLLSTVTYLIVR